MSAERQYYVEHTVRMTITEVVSATNAREAIQLARIGHAEPVDSEVTNHAATNWNAHRADAS